MTTRCAQAKAEGLWVLSEPATRYPPDEKRVQRSLVQAELDGHRPPEPRLFDDLQHASIPLPVADALPAVQEHLEHWPGDDPPSPDELAELVALTVRYVRASQALLWYAEAVGGKPRRN